MTYEFDFDTAIDDMLNTDLDRDKSNLHIWGGEFAAGTDELRQFITTWADHSFDMPYHIWEYAHTIEFTRSDEPPVEGCENLLVRLCVFGTDGNLSLRRDGNRFLWHFIGAFEPPLNREQWNVQDFFAANPDAKLHEYADEEAMLWGEWQEAENSDEAPHIWHDDRVGWAKLNYPFPDQQAKPERARIKYSLFTLAGQPAFVWWKELC